MAARYDVFEGGDGLGKTYFLDCLRDCFSELGRPVFDLNTYWKEHKEDPTDFIRPGGLLYLSEPSYACEGLVIRQGLIAEPGEGYSEFPVRNIAEWFAKDRARILTNLVRPAVESGMHVVSSRNFLSSFAYQPVQASLRNPPEELPIGALERIPGNALALNEFKPDEVFICTVSEKKRQERMANRSEAEHDNATTERLDIAQRVSTFYDLHAPAWLGRFGIKNSFLSLDGTKEDSKILARQYYERLYT